jgi:addiction module RelB/DinJ family antitoxin
MSETVIRSRVDSNLKTEAQALLERLGLTMSDAIRLFLHQLDLKRVSLFRSS